jgi:ABC-type branched-subunit amino acid transport system substrate-binding protein
VGSIFGPAEDRIGITPTRISLCVHTPIQILKLLFNTDPADLNVYWDARNADGGLLGRSVDVTYTDDKNTEPDTAAALEKCAEHDPFAVVSGTVDTTLLDIARAWAERTHTLYYFNFASDRTPRRYSYSPFVSTETVGRLGAQWIMKAHPRQRVGLVYQGTPSYAPGKQTFDATLAARGVSSTDVSTEKNQGNYQAQIDTLRKNADVVFVLDDPLGTTALLRQASAQRYTPQWVLVFEANLTTDVLGSAAVSPHPIEALGVWPPYRAGSYGGPYARYGQEVRQFEETYRRIRGHDNTSEVAWIFWTFWRVIADQFERCGLDCTRNRFLAVRQWNADPFCPIDFRPGANFGGTTITINRAYSPSPGLAAWAEVPGEICRDHF